VSNPIRRFLFAALLSTLGWATLLVGCTDPAQVSEQQATLHAERLAKLADDDVQELRRGMPRGAKALADRPVSGKDASDRSAVRQLLDRVRGGDHDLEIAKSTFFALTDETGAVIASDQSPDRLAGRHLSEAFPALSKVLKGELTQTRGSIEELAGARTGGDEQWVLAVPVGDGTTLRGAYVSGWSLRRFAFHLEETLKHDLVEQAAHSSAGTKQPLVYVFVFAGAKIYGAPVTPLVNAQALQALDLPGHTTQGAAFHGKLEITGRAFGVAARRCAQMGDDVGVAVLRSET
jgi:hypothetical protein